MGNVASIQYLVSGRTQNGDWDRKTFREGKAASFDRDSPLADAAPVKMIVVDLVWLANAPALGESSGAGGRCGGGPCGRVEGAVDRGLGDIGETQVVVAGVTP